MGLFSNFDNREMRLAEYKLELGKYKNCLGKYEGLIKVYEGLILEHDNQVKEYDDSLQRYQNQLEQYTDKYDEIIKNNDAILKENLHNMITKQDDIIQSMQSTQKKNKGLKRAVGFLGFFNLITLSGVGFIILYLLEIL